MTQDDAGSAPMRGSQSDTFEAAVINWISEATSLIPWRSDGGQKIMADACERCWATAKPDGGNTYPVTLTDAEQEAIEAAIAFFSRGYGTTADTLRGLLERLGR